MNKATLVSISVLASAIAFIGANASAEETASPAHAPEIKSWEQIAYELSNYDPIDCYNAQYGELVCRPKLEKDGTYGEECRMMRISCGVLDPSDYNLGSTTYDPDESPSEYEQMAIDEGWYMTPLEDTSWMFED